MAEALAIVGAVAGVLGSTAKVADANPIKRQFNYVCRYKNNIKRLRDQLKKLEVASNSLRQRIEAAVRNGERIDPVVHSWLEEADDLETKSRALLSGMVETHWSYSCSKKTYKMARAIFKHLDSGKFERVSISASPVGMEAIPKVGSEVFESRKKKKREILDALGDDNVQVIGICGLGGVGKTRIAQEVAREAKAENLFDQVVMAVVSQEPDVKKIQAELLEPLCSRISEETLNARAARLRERLKDVKKILVILDDAWNKIEFEEIGIPLGEEHEGCKIMLVSRDREVCTSVKADKIFTVDLLLEEEAWNLFQKTASLSVNDQHLNPVPRAVAKECGALPLAIVTVASALQNKSEDSWINALKQLRKAHPENIGDFPEVYTRLQLSYKLLKSKEAESLFLHCCLFAEDFDIPLEDLVRHGMGLQIFKGIDRLQDARIRVRVLIDKLKSRFLLMDGSKQEYVKMHDVVRDMALWMQSNVFMVNHERSFEKWPSEECCSNYSCVSVWSRSIRELPLGSSFPNLRMLWLQQNNCYYPDGPEAPDSLFEGMAALKVVQMEGIWFKRLQSSACSLINLRNLHLHSCGVESISGIGELVNLEILTLEYLELLELPAEMRRLTNLKLLSIKRCMNLSRIPRGVISSLVELEEIHMINSFRTWEAGEERIIQKNEAGEEGKIQRNASILELASLERLSCLIIDIQHSAVLAKDIPFLPKLTNYSILCSLDTTMKTLSRRRGMLHKALRLGGIDSGYGRCGPQKAIRLGGIRSPASWVLDLLPKAEYMELRDIDNLEDLDLDPLPPGSFQELKEISIGNFGRLRHIWKSPSQHICLSNLRSIEIDLNVKLTNLFSLSVARSLSQLETIGIRNCPLLEQVLSEEDSGSGGVHMIEFPKLKTLHLYNLPKLRTFCQGVSNVKCLSLSELIIEDVGRNIISEEEQDTCLQFIQQEVTVINLKNWAITGSGISSQLTFLELSGIYNVEYLFTPTAANFLLLRTLHVFNCQSLEKIIRKEEGEEGQEIQTLCFPLLEYIWLSELPKLSCFSGTKHDLQFPSLTGLYIKDCHSFKTFAAGLPNTPKLSSYWRGKTEDLNRDWKLYSNLRSS